MAHSEEEEVDLTESSSDEDELRTKKIKAPGVAWYLWAFCNNERGCILLFYVTCLGVSLALVALVSLNDVITYELAGDGGSLYATVYNTPANSFFVAGDCAATQTVSSSELFPSSTTGPRGTALAMIVLDSLLIFGLVMPIAYASIDVAGLIRYERMEPFWRGVLFSYATSVFLMFMILAMVSTVGMGFYNAPESCFEKAQTAVTALAVAEGATFSSASWAASVRALNLVTDLCWIGLSLSLINILLYASLFCSVRNWYNTKAWQPSRVDDSRFELV